MNVNELKNVSQFCEADNIEDALALCHFEPFCFEKMDGGFLFFQSESDYDNFIEGLK